MKHTVDRAQRVSSTRGGRRREVDPYFEASTDDWEAMYARRDVVGAIHQRRMKRALCLVDDLGLAAGSEVLELGTGAGLLAVALAGRGLRVEATDVVETMLERTLERVIAAGLRDLVSVSAADAEEMPFPDSTFDLVVALGVLPWVHSPLQAACEVRRVLRPTGQAVLTIGNRWRLTFLIDPLMNPALAPVRHVAKAILARTGHPIQPRAEVPAHLLRGAEFERLLVEAGLQVVSAETLGFGPVTFLRREVLSVPAGVRLDSLLQRRADLGTRVICSFGAQHLVLVRPLPD
jgi:ubiquinone/menaquinone biosynthesis C-methylase UbiE